MSTDIQSNTLTLMSSRLRRGPFLIGAAMTLGRAALRYYPAKQSSAELDQELRAVKIEVHEDPSSMLIVALLSGSVLLMLFGANGFPLQRFSASNIAAETHTVAALAQRIFQDNPALLQNVGPLRPGVAGQTSHDQNGDGEDPSESQSAVAAIEQSGIKVKVYDLRSVPSGLLVDSISKWPGGDPPATVNEFGFSSKPDGQDNKSWAVKVGGLDSLVMTCGGHGKTREGAVHFASA